MNPNTSIARVHRSFWPIIAISQLGWLAVTALASYHGKWTGVAIGAGFFVFLTIGQAIGLNAMKSIRNQ